MKQSIASDAVKLTTSKIITMMISMITAMLLSRFRTLEEYGTYSQIMLIINLTTTVFTMGLPNSINYFLSQAECPKEREYFLSVYYSLSTLLSFITGLVLVISAPLIISYFNNELIKNFIYILVILPWTIIMLSSIDNILIVYKKTNLLMIYRILNSILLLLIIIIVKVFNLSFEMYMALFIIVESSFAVSVYIIIRNIAGQLKISLDTKLISTIMKFSIPIGLATVAGTLKKELDKLIIAFFYDTELLAIYANAAREMPVVIIASSITAVLLPQIVKMLNKNEKDKAINLWGDTTLFSYIFICFIATGFFVYAPEVMSLLYSNKYIAGTPVFRVYAIVLLFRSTYFGMILNSIGKTKIILYSSILSLVSSSILNFVFYYMFGFVGPAIATLVTTLLSAIYLLWATAKATEISFEKVFPWKKIWNITMINICYGLAFAIIKKVLPLEDIFNEVLESVVLGLIWGIIYFSTNYKLLRTKWEVLNNN